jgi:DNA-binding transcriptional ArsR family regulator
VKAQVSDLGLSLCVAACVRRRRVKTYNLMVVDLLSDERADRVFHALADATRRDIVLQALEGEHSVSALARRYPVSFAAVQKHVAVLESAGLVTKHKSGREQLVRSNIETIREASRLLDQLEAVWRDRIDRIDEILADDKEERPR